MGGGQTSVARGRVWGLLWLALALAAAITVIPVTSAWGQDSVPSCAPAVARVVSLQGDVELKRGEGWVPVRRLDTPLCAGDSLRTGNFSRVLLHLQPETLVRVDQNTVIALKQSGEEIEVEFFAAELAQALPGAQSLGAGYFITRFPKKFKVKTPHVNAAVEGTEFMVELSRDATKLTVLEGKVSSQSTVTGDTQLVDAGQSLASGASGAGTIAAVIKPQDAVQWVLRYPPISDGSSASRAEELLRMGSVDEALAEIDSVLSGDSDNSDALALRAVIQVAKNDKAEALRSAGNATAANFANHRAWLAMSYAQQASFDLDAALESALKASNLQPSSALANARVAELYLSLGDVGRAEDAARAAVTANPDESHAHSILGFVHLAEIDTRRARADFRSAILLDSFSALPRLGTGLAIIRDGDLKAGREQIEIAVALDPSNSLIRSYVGKAYYEENTAARDELAAAQFDIAKQLDSRDPTPDFYEAILLQSRNRPVHAIDSVHVSVAKNDNRAVYRSKLQLDDDSAARTASIAALYGELGFEKLAILESSRAIGENAGNYSAHTLLALAYADQPRHDIARVSEVLQAQIRQPVSYAAVPPVLSTENLGVLRQSGPGQLGANEFNELFNRDGVRFEIDGLVGERDTAADQVQISALSGGLSATFGQLHYETDGFTENDAASRDIYDLLIHKRLTASSSIQLDLERTEFDVGETFLGFDPNPDNQLPITVTEEGNAYRLSGHHATDYFGDWIWSTVYDDRSREVIFNPAGFAITNADNQAYAAEAQQWFARGAFEAVSGIGYVEDKFSSSLEGVEARSRAANAYLYGQWTSVDNRIRLHAGLAADWYRRSFSDGSSPVSRERLSPKLGLTWTLRPGSTLRLAALSAVRRPFVGSRTIEPTQVAGFNQYFSGFDRLYGDFEGSISRRAGVAFDQELSSSLKGGIEFARRKIEVPSVSLARDFSWRESTGYFYLYKTFASAMDRPAGAWDLVATLEGNYERTERPQVLTGSEAIVDLETFRWPIGLRLFYGARLGVRLQATYVSQAGSFSADVGEPIFERDDEAWIADVALDIEFPRRRGVVTLGVLNLGDEFIDLVESDVFNPRIAARRLAYLKVRFTY